jgi:uncharacterized lipoprotein YddW (UPF0748 family)
MSIRCRLSDLPFPAALALFALALAVAVPLAARARETGEVRALWVARTSLTTPSSIASMIQSARSSGFNTLLVQVRARGDGYFNGGLEPRAAALAGQPRSFDPLDATLKLAHQQGLRVHAWVNVNLVASAVDPPSANDHVVVRHPEWLMVPQALSREMALIAPTSRLYVDKLARWIRSQMTEVEGLYLSPIPEAAADYTVEVVADMVSRYEVDGVHLDYMRYPNDEFDCSREALSLFGTYLAGKLPETSTAGTRRSANPLTSLELYPERWREFRRARLTALLARLRQAVKIQRPQAVVSVAVVPDAEDAAARRLQDWRGWLERGLVDVVCPMAYATDSASFTAQVASARQVAGDRPVWAGIGAYRLSSSQTIENIQIARRLGASGIVLFSYDSLITPPGGAEYLSEVGRAAFIQ